MKQISIVKVSQGTRIPLNKAVCEKMGLSKGDYVIWYENDQGEIAICKPAIVVGQAASKEKEASTA